MHNRLTKILQKTILKWVAEQLNKKEIKMDQPHLHCFWCGKPLGNFHATVTIGGVSRMMHQNLFKDCVKQHREWYESQPQLQLAERG